MKRYIAIIVSGIILVLLSCDRVEDTWNPEGKEISSVTVRFEGERNFDEKGLMPFISSAEGSSYSAERSDDDIRALYESGYVEDARVVCEPENGKVRLIYVVSVRPQIGPIVFVGNTLFSNIRLVSEIEARTDDGELSLEDIDDNAKKIRNFYKSHGYPNVNVRVTASNGGPATANDFRFIIDEGIHQSIPE